MEMINMYMVRVFLVDETVFDEEVQVEGIGDYLQNLFDTEEIAYIEIVSRFEKAV